MTLRTDMPPGPIWMTLAPSAFAPARGTSEVHSFDDVVAWFCDPTRWESWSGTKRGQRVWSPALFEGDHRSRDRHKGYTYALVLDYDTDPNVGPSTFARLPGRWVAHPTTSYSASIPKWRAVIGLSRPMTIDEDKLVGRWVAETRPWGEVDSTAQVDPSRCYFLPSHRGADDPYPPEAQPRAGGSGSLDVDAAVAEARAWQAADEARAAEARRGKTYTLPQQADGSQMARRLRALLEAECERIRGLGDGRRHAAMKAGYLFGGYHGLYGGVGYSESEAVAAICSAAMDAGHRDKDGRLEVSVADAVAKGRLDLPEPLEDRPLTSLPAPPFTGESWSKPSRSPIDPPDYDLSTGQARPSAPSSDAPQPMPSSPDAATLLQLDTTKGGAPKATISNVAHILRSDPGWSGRLWRCAFSDSLMFDGDRVVDGTILRVLDHIAVAYGVNAAKANVYDAMTLVGDESSRHPVREYLGALRWDGVERLGSLLTSRYIPCKDIGSESVDLRAAYARRWAVSAVARIMRPGCKVDTMLVLKGEQGARKSTAFAVLGGAWFSDSPIAIGTDDAPQALRGVWIQELAELDSMRRKDVTEIKAFLSMYRDSYRVRYDRTWTERDRQTVIVGTTNEDTFLADRTGSRRFWVAEVEDRINVDAIQRDRDQLWAEAVALYRAGEQWWLTDAEDAARHDTNDEYAFEEPWMADLLARTSGGVAFELAEELAGLLDCKPGQVQQRDILRAAAILKDHGYQKRRQVHHDGVRRTTWRLT